MIPNILTIGPFTLAYAFTSVWIRHASGEVGQFPYSVFVTEIGGWESLHQNVADNPAGAEWLIATFYEKHF